MWNTAIRTIGALKTSVYLYAIPPLTLVAGTLLLDETVTLLGTAGIVLVIGGMALSNLGRAKG